MFQNPQESATPPTDTTQGASEAATAAGAPGAAEVSQASEQAKPAVVAADTWIESNVEAMRSVVRQQIEHWTGWDNGLATTFTNVAMAVLMLALLVTVYVVLRRVFVVLVHRVSAKTKTKFDDNLVEAYFPQRAAWFLAMLATLPTPHLLFADFPVVKDWGFRVVAALAILLGARTATSLGLGIYTYYHSRSEGRRRTRWVLQVLNILVYIPTILLVLGAVFKLEMGVVAGGISAAGVALMFVFKDPLNGAFNAMQIEMKKNFRIGDWITVEGFGVSGTVEDIGVSFVVIRRFDGTLANVPTKDIFSKVVVNHQELQAIGGRRFMENILVDASSIRRLTQAEIDRFSKVPLIADYVAGREEVIRASNESAGVDVLAEPLAGRGQTNIAVLRMYIKMFLLDNADIDQGKTLMVRTLEPTPEGVPVQIYCWSRHPGWVKHESVEDDVMDRVFIAARELDLRIAQNPLSQDLAMLRGGQGASMLIETGAAADTSNHAVAAGEKASV